MTAILILVAIAVIFLSGRLLFWAVLGALFIPMIWKAYQGLKQPGKRKPGKHATANWDHLTDD